MLGYVLDTARQAGCDKLLVVVGHKVELVQQAFADDARDIAWVIQSPQMGTGHAVMVCKDQLAGLSGPVLVLAGDGPLIRPETLRELIETHRAAQADCTLATCILPEPGGYGRIVRDEAGNLLEIVEALDASEAQKAICEVNVSIYCFDAAALRQAIGLLKNDNAKGEFYLTDIVGLARARGLRAAVITCPEAETLGVNSRADLAAAEAAFQARARAAAMENGATLTDPASVFFALDTVVGRDVTIGPNVVFGPEVTIESGARIEAFCHLEGCHVSRGAIVGPFARLRPGAELAEDVRVGNFVEVKNAILDEGAKVNHLSYIGDAHVGARANVGAGTITCNYDGVFKHRTEIGAGAFIGSNTALVAPVRVGAGALVAAGSAITADVRVGALALARGRQANKEGLGLRLMARLRALKTAKGAR
jgi:bifunctional UDP-N-acetylglucosamine pyrophosphorylase/glucosamine-1-phosphate N-acetyltransferase